jgi:hypothetical protein
MSALLKAKAFMVIDKRLPPFGAGLSSILNQFGDHSSWHDLMFSAEPSFSE